MESRSGGIVCSLVMSGGVNVHCERFHGRWWSEIAALVVKLDGGRKRSGVDDRRNKENGMLDRVAEQ